MITIAQARNNFFDRTKVVKAMDKATRSAMSRGGAIVMREAKKSIRNAAIMQRGRVKAGERRKQIGTKPSSPGQPPLSRTGLLREFIYFSAEKGSQGWSTVVGPVKLNQKVGDAPHALEFGGPSAVLVRRRRRTRGRGGRYAQIKEAPEVKVIHVQQHPFMAPALHRMIERGRLPELWRDAITKGG